MYIIVYIISKKLKFQVAINNFNIENYYRIKYVKLFWVKTEKNDEPENKTPMLAEFS